MKQKQLVNQVNEKEVEIYLYGMIGRWLDIDVNNLIKELDGHRKTGITHAKFYVNSEGGEVLAGQAFYNYISRSQLNMTFVIDGIAGSIMAMILTNKKCKVVANKYSKLMYHRVSGMVSGNSDEVRSYAGMIDTFETDLISMFGDRTGMDVKQAKKEFFGGEDRWVSAQEALTLKLVDEIIDNYTITEPKNLNNSSEVYQHFNNQLINCITKNEKMKNVAVLLNLAEGSSPEVIAQAITNLLADKNKAIGESQSKDAKITELSNKIAEGEKAKVKNLIDAAIASKRLGEDMRETYTAMATNSFEMAEKVINSLPAVGRIVDQLGGGADAGIPETEKAWTFKDYMKNNKAENLLKNNPERFKALYKAEFNKEYQS